jgi:hypothetical protein
MIRRRQPPREAGDCLLGELVEHAEVDPRRGRSVLETFEQMVETPLGGPVDARGTHAGPLQQAAALGPRRLDHGIGFTLGGGDGIRRAAFGLEDPVDCPSDG